MEHRRRAYTRTAVFKKFILTRTNAKRVNCSLKIFTADMNMNMQGLKALGHDPET